MKRLLIANRGEIAVRIARTARTLGIETVAVVSEADREALITEVVDAVAVIGPAPAAQSYLSQDAILAAARTHGADAIHPGYGFLSENAGFARRVIDAGLVWVGPDPTTIELMGDKARAIVAARAAAVPTLPGSDGALGDDDDAPAAAAAVGFPLLIKARAGGGGRGIRLVRSPDEFDEALSIARSEARASFGDDAVYLERFVNHARHVEVQILGDGRDAIHLGDRDCSMQRRSQKVLEEAPAPGLPDATRERIRRSSVDLARACGYSGAGTVEFLYDPASGDAFFIEMNTRLQVEHPVTETLTGLDLVAEQLRIADGEPLSLTQDQVELNGHAIECRINAEDPARGFFPSPGTIERFSWPEGVRMDAGFRTGSVVTPFYDSLVAKLIVHADDRDTAIRAMSSALADTVIDGIQTTLPLHRALVDAPAFRDVAHYTTFIEAEPEAWNRS
ncbi:acetyl-CoA carboxylase biotin carboxylase subunit [Microbacterium testaceum]|uniref:acetyl-CoA carboxylase biotin carboxylase subunit n=1 Tax=Microbacterium testaceum TaxID=2033 RepID=UPI0025CE7806|nr:acetyl-CoA carboxylase biotin carboxylase subunit [Microbacterium testaceum]MDZ5144377.1 acetyl-CoA carboxylase biotin carboxylase subunit [Microbacterium testaceum]